MDTMSGSAQSSSGKPEDVEAWPGLSALGLVSGEGDTEGEDDDEADDPDGGDGDGARGATRGLGGGESRIELAHSSEGGGEAGGGSTSAG